ncbi:OmpA family protein [uncultured Muribaculum sp.]|uniref:OmpA family protein n=1 Tax=uncultured Muribaculum sp. TaxID=1918613 RepID=UPI00272E427A|nr:OmpA family protein [uncultured Muribaculum sp.]
MKRQLYILTIALAALTSGLQAYANADTHIRSISNVDKLLMAPEVSYHKGLTESPGWKGNWFLGVNAGANAFVGSPKGCADLWGRIKPNVGAYVGKWFTPTVGSRISFNGFQLTDGDKNTQDYWGVSTDFLWSLTNSLCGNYNQSRFGLMPYVGVGMLHNSQAQTNPFALSYGVMAEYGVTSRLKVTMEFGGKTTFSNFDGFGNANSFGGDNLLSLSAGLSFTFGQSGFRKVINAKPVLIDNARLRETLADIYEENGRLSRMASNDARVIAELKKIMEIEGLLTKYGNLFTQPSGQNNTDYRQHPVNDYSGLNKLRARLNGYHLPDKKCALSSDDVIEDPEDSTGLIDDIFELAISSDSIPESGNELDRSLNNDGLYSPGDGIGNNSRIHNDYISLISAGKKCIGSPIFFFFRLGTSELTDPSQLVNLDEIARIAKTYGLAIRVTGAADSATGTTDINNSLGNNRSDYIITQLQKRGVSTSLITKINKGGIDLLNPDEANRHCRVELLVQ